MRNFSRSDKINLAGVIVAVLGIVVAILVAVLDHRTLEKIPSASLSQSVNQMPSENEVDGNKSASLIGLWQSDARPESLEFFPNGKVIATCYGRVRHGSYQQSDAAQTKFNYADAQGEVLSFTDGRLRVHYVVPTSFLGMKLDDAESVVVYERPSNKVSPVVVVVAALPLAILGFVALIAWRISCAFTSIWSWFTGS